ncbi:MAG: hypothetical protein MUC96_28165 [Myxococcaceae bacterium]|jgi:hypothetical protein|nr:hypothetical protein [Myxococcaceae bacterium]
MSVSRAVVLGVLVAACGPMPMTPDAGGSCASALKTPPNLAPNAEFECAGTPPFRALGTGSRVETVTGRSGQALRFTTASGLFNNSLTSEWKVVATGTATYCLTAWLKSTSTATVLRLTRFQPTSGQGLNQDFTSPGPLTTWTKAPPNVKLDLSVSAGDEVTVSVNDRTETAGTVIELDDVDLWQSASGRCDEAR